MVFRAHRTEMRLRKRNAHYDMQFRRRGEDEEAVLAIGRVPQLGDTRFRHFNRIRMVGVRTNLFG